MVNGYAAGDVINAIFQWSKEDDNSEFDTSFIESLSEKLDQFGELTPRQEQALTNIVEKWEIDVEQYS